MCDALTNEQTQIEEQIEAINVETATKDELVSIGAKVAPYVNGLTALALNTSDEAEEDLHKRRHVLEHFFSSIMSTMARAVHTKHDALEQSVKIVKESMTEEAFDKLVDEKQAEFAQYQYDVRLKQNAIVSGILANVNEEDTLEVLDAHSNVMVQAHMRQAMQRSMGGLQEMLSQLSESDLEEEAEAATQH